MWDKFLDKMLRLLLSIPRSVRAGIIHLIVIGVIIFDLIYGIKFVIDFFNGTSSLKPSEIVLSMVAAFIIFWAFKKGNKEQ